MSLNLERQAIESRFIQEWATGSPAVALTPFGLPGHTFTPPVGQSSVRLSIMSGESFNKSMGDPGSNLIRYAGVIHIQIYTKGGVGSKAATDLAELIRPIFTNWSDDWRDGKLRVRTMRAWPAVETLPFYMLPVSFAFTRDEFQG